MNSAITTEEIYVYRKNGKPVKAKLITVVRYRGFFKKEIDRWVEVEAITA